MSGTTVKSTSPAVPRWARKSTLVLAIAALALAVFGTTTQTWLTVHLDPAQLGQAVNSQDGLQVQGSKAATTVTALALVALAGGLAASIAGRIARWIITALILLAAAGIVSAAAVVHRGPAGRRPGLDRRRHRDHGQQRAGGRHGVPGPRRRRRRPAGAQRPADHPGRPLLEVAHEI